MTTPKLTFERRMELLERHSLAMEDLQAAEKRLPQGTGKRWTYWALTSCDGCYPGDGANTFPIRFVDPVYTPTAGTQTLTTQLHSAFPRTVARTTNGQWCMPGELVMASPIPPPFGTTNKGRWLITPLKTYYYGVLNTSLARLGSASVRVYTQDAAGTWTATRYDLTVWDAEFLATGESLPAGTWVRFEWEKVAWVVRDVRTSESGSSTDPTTTTTTTPEPCSGRCRWIWNAADQIWELDEDTCSGTTTTTTTTTTTSTTTTTTGDPGTTTTPDPCECTTTTPDPGTTTTPDPGTTTTPEPTTCSCVYPAWCGSVDGECTYTNCSSGYVATVVNCTTTTTSTTPDPGTTTTTCDCNTTTVEPGCTDGCDWFWRPAFAGGGGWQLVSNGCTGDCSCLAPEESGEDCGTAHTECIPNGPPEPCACSGECQYYWVDDLAQWMFLRSDCSDCNNCHCTPPSFPGEFCTAYSTPCQSVATTTTTPAPCAYCYTTTTADPGSTTTTTTPVPGECSGDCKWQWDTGAEAWVLIAPSCQAGCTCREPAYSGLADCEVTWTRCGPSFTTSTTTTTTEDPGCCLPAIACTYQFNYGTRLFELISDTCGEGCDCPPVINQCLPCQDSYTGGTGWIVNLPCGRFNSQVSYIAGGPGSGICSEEDCSSTNCDDFFGAGQDPWPANPSSNFYTCGGGDCFGGPTTTTTSSTTTTIDPSTEGACCGPEIGCFAPLLYSMCMDNNPANTFYPGAEDCLSLDPPCPYS